MLCQRSGEGSDDPILHKNKYFISVQDADGSGASVTMVMEPPQTRWWYLVAVLNGLERCRLVLAQRITQQGQESLKEPQEEVDARQ